MRATIGLAGFLLLSCSGDDGGVRKDPEICDDGVDNDGDLLVDCDDGLDCGGPILCANQGDDDDDDDTSEPPPVIEIVYDTETCCDFEFSQSSCPSMSIGTFEIINRDPNLDATYDVRCDFVGPQLFPIEFQVVGSSAQPTAGLVNADLYSASSVTIEVFFACKTQLNQDFATECTVDVATEDDDDDELIQIDAHHVAR